MPTARLSSPARAQTRRTCGSASVIAYLQRGRVQTRLRESGRRNKCGARIAIGELRGGVRQAVRRRQVGSEVDVATRVGDQVVRSLVLHRRTLGVLRQAERGATAVVCALLLLLGEAERAQAELAAIVLQQTLDELRVVEAEAAVHRRLGILLEVGQQIVQADGRRLELVGRLAALLEHVETRAERRANRLERARHPGVAEHRLQRLDLLAAAALERLHHHRAEVGVVHHLARLRHLLGVGERLHRLRHLLRVLQLRRDLVDVERRLHAVAAAAEAAPLLELVGAAEEHCGVDEVLDGRNCAIPAAAQFLRLGGAPATVELVQLD